MMKNNLLRLLILPILINATDYYSIEAARARSEESLKKFKAKTTESTAPTSRAIAQPNNLNGNVPRVMNKAMNNIPNSVAGFQCAPPFYRPVLQRNCGQSNLNHRVSNSNQPMPKMCRQKNGCPQNTISNEMDKKITEYAYRYDLGPEAEEDMKMRAGYDELMVEEMQILDEINVDDTVIPKVEPVVCRKRGCPYYKCYRKKNCTCC
jgi:hypothetical protein